MDSKNIDYFEKGLYEPIEGLSNPEDAQYILRDNRSYKSFCPYCKDMTVWLPLPAGELRSGILQIRDAKGFCRTFGGYINFGKAFFCSMCKQELIFYFKSEGGKIFKVGAYPSYKDLSRGRLMKELSIPSSRIPSELSTALGLRAQGVIIGAYAYLRRVYETLITEASCEAIKESAFTKEDFQNARVAERIKMLANYLPQCMQDNPIAYGILSKGLHELSEEDCAQAFDLLYELIKNILEEKERKRVKKLREKELSTALQKVGDKFLKKQGE